MELSIDISGVIGWLRRAVFNTCGRVFAWARGGLRLAGFGVLGYAAIGSCLWTKTAKPVWWSINGWLELDERSARQAAAANDSLATSLLWQLRTVFLLFVLSFVSGVASRLCYRLAGPAPDGGASSAGKGEGSNPDGEDDDVFDDKHHTGRLTIDSSNVFGDSSRTKMVILNTHRVALAHAAINKKAHDEKYWFHPPPPSPSADDDDKEKPETEKESPNSNGGGAEAEDEKEKKGKVSGDETCSATADNNTDNADNASEVVVCPDDSEPEPESQTAAEDVEATTTDRAASAEEEEETEIQVHPGSSQEGGARGDSEEEENEKKGEEEKGAPARRVWWIDLVLDEKADAAHTAHAKHSDSDGYAMPRWEELAFRVNAVTAEGDHIVLRLQSLGGYVSEYGFASECLASMKKGGAVRLTVCVDRYAASGGYMLACIADEVVVAPLAMIGSIGVVMTMPNVRDAAAKVGVQIHQLTAGEHKRTLDMYGEVTPEKIAKEQENLERTMVLFCDHVGKYRPSFERAKCGTGEVWYGAEALALGLVDRLGTSLQVYDELANGQKLRVLRVTFARGEEEGLLKSLSKLCSSSSIFSWFMHKGSAAAARGVSSAFRAVLGLPSSSSSPPSFSAAGGPNNAPAFTPPPLLAQCFS